MSRKHSKENRLKTYKRAYRDFYKHHKFYGVISRVLLVDKRIGLYDISTQYPDVLLVSYIPGEEGYSENINRRQDVVFIQVLLCIELVSD